MNQTNEKSHNALQDSPDVPHASQRLIEALAFLVVRKYRSSRSHEAEGRFKGDEPQGEAELFEGH